MSWFPCQLFLIGDDAAVISEKAWLACLSRNAAFHGLATEKCVPSHFESCFHPGSFALIGLVCLNPFLEWRKSQVRMSPCTRHNTSLNQPPLWLNQFPSIQYSYVRKTTFWVAETAKKKITRIRGHWPLEVTGSKGR